MGLLGLPFCARRLMTSATMVFLAMLIEGSAAINLQAQAPIIRHSALERFPNDPFRPHGYTQMNGAQTNAVSATSVFRHRLEGNTGENRVTAYTTLRGGDGLWRFDFQGAENFAPGGIKVKLGRVIFLDAYSVVFRVDRPGERVELSDELRPGER